jgi:hypothetical protein
VGAPETVDVATTAGRFFFGSWQLFPQGKSNLCFWPGLRRDASRELNDRTAAAKIHDERDILGSAPKKSF